MSVTEEILTRELFLGKGFPISTCCNKLPSTIDVKSTSFITIVITGTVFSTLDVDFPEVVINSIVVVKIPNPTDISLVWVSF
ncbi:hypothetical protein TNCV_4627431 [Trichonephila clavipes]|nr:hypothetical protein TNCV_4627431 [Trichonephila clavipes]